MATLAPLIGELLGIQTAPIDYSQDDRRHLVRIGDAVDIEIEDFVPPQTPQGEVGKAHRHVPSGQLDPDDRPGGHLAGQRL